jgi:hypothetical protein
MHVAQYEQHLHDDRTNRVVLVGESNLYGADPNYALYPSPDQSAGYRLAVLILGMSQTAYLETFARTNLCPDKWSMRQARFNADKLLSRFTNFVLLGSKVSAAFNVNFKPFTCQFYGEDQLDGSDPRHARMLVLPHPSGRCRLWSDQGSINNARRSLVAFAPWLKPVIGFYT